MQIPLSRRAREIQPSLTLVVSAKAKEMIAAGVPVLNLTAGEPDFDTPAAVKQAAVQALDQGFTKYTPGGGILELKQAIAERYRRDMQLDYAPDEILVSNGGKHALHNVFQSLLDPGDEVIVPAPYWVSYTDMVGLSDGRPVILPTEMSAGFKITAEQLDAAITPRTKLLVLNSPCNPTGAVYRREELGRIAEVIAASGLLVVSDDVYERFVFDGRDFANLLSVAPQLKAQVVIVNSASKTYSMPGWRMGFALGPQAIIAAATRIQGQATGCPGSISQKALAAAIGGDQQVVETFRQSFQDRRDLLLEGLAAVDGIEPFRPRGAFYIFADVSRLYPRLEGVGGSVDFCRHLLDHLRIAAVPGSAFGDDRCVRFSFVAAEAQIRTAVAHLQEAFGA